MGVGFSHGGAQWSYSGFHNFRRRLAKEVGIDLDEMQGFSKKPPEREYGQPILTTDEWIKRMDGTPGTKPWAGVKDDIKGLLLHSDCDGHLTPKQCLKIAPRLRQLTRGWHRDRRYGIDIMESHDATNADKLAIGMMEAAREGVRFKFS